MEFILKFYSKKNWKKSHKILNLGNFPVYICTTANLGIRTDFFIYFSDAINQLCDTI